MYSCRDAYSKAQVIQALSSDFLVIDGTGHNLQYSTPREFADVVKYVLE